MQNPITQSILWLRQDFLKWILTKLARIKRLLNEMSGKKRSRKILLDKEGGTLDKFIDENSGLLSAIGILVAIIALCLKQNNFFLNALSFIAIGGLVIVGWEIYSKFPRNLSLRLWLFYYCLLWGGIIIIAYWVYEFRLIWNICLWIPITLISATFITSTLRPIIRFFSFTRNLFGIGVDKPTWHQKLFIFLFVLTILGISLYIGLMLSLGTNVVMNQFYRYFNK